MDITITATIKLTAVDELPDLDLIHDEFKNAVQDWARESDQILSYDGSQVQVTEDV